MKPFSLVLKILQASLGIRRCPFCKERTYYDTKIRHIYMDTCVCNYYVYIQNITSVERKMCGREELERDVCMGLYIFTLISHMSLSSEFTN